MLVPGFFGFADLGDLGYFGHVVRRLNIEATRLTVDVQVHVVRTRPTASLVRRAQRLHDTIAALPEGDVHLVGHSTGGLDARVLCTPGLVLPDRNVRATAERVRTVVCVATPHRGTALARIFQGVRGRGLLRSLSMATVLTLTTGKRPVRALVKLAGLVQGVANRTIGSPDLIDDVFDSLLKTFDEERRHSVREFFSEVGEDTSLVGQLTPEAIDPLTVLAPDRPGVRYVSVLTRSPAPSVGKAVKEGPKLRKQAALGLYATLHTATSRRAITLPAAIEETVRVAFGETVKPGANDAIVPTRSQPWGEVLAAVEADHLDVLGHFAGRDHHPPHYDWLPSGAHFDKEHFEALWKQILEALVTERTPREA